ncbi:MAG: transcriptional repressor [Eubacteriales bacterium]|nr:transcriptional repressor [Eubacteriales bacterium]
MATLKYSRQREAIREFLMDRTDHPTADTVYENIRITYPNISLGTVYRNLNLLAEIGEIQKLSSFAGADHFDGRTDTHCHFYCTHCQRITDMDDLDPNVMLEEARAHFGGKITEFSGRFTGICEDCMTVHR